MITMTDGTLFQRENSPGSGTFTTLAQVMKITPPKQVRKTADIYTMDSSAPTTKTGAYESMQAIVELAADFDSAAHQALFTDQDAKSQLNYQIVFPNPGAAQWRFAAVISGIEPGDAEAEGTNPQTLSVTFNLAGSVARTW